MTKRLLWWKEQYAPAYDVEVTDDGDLINVHLWYSYPPHYGGAETREIDTAMLAHIHQSKDFIAAVAKAYKSGYDWRDEYDNPKV